MERAAAEKWFSDESAHEKKTSRHRDREVAFAGHPCDKKRVGRPELAQQRSWMAIFHDNPRLELSDAEFIWGVQNLMAMPQLARRRDTCTKTGCRDGSSNVDSLLACNSCSGSYRTRRHDDICGGMSAICKEHNLYATTNLKGVFPEILSRTVEGPDIIIFTGPSSAVLLDFTVAHVPLMRPPQAQGHSTLAHRTYAKNRLYGTWESNDHEKFNLKFEAVAVTTTGKIAASALDALRAVAKHGRRGLFGRLVEFISASVIKLTCNGLALRSAQDAILRRINSNQYYIARQRRKQLQGSSGSDTDELTDSDAESVAATQPL